jgi:hypothetical protein
MYLSSFDMSSIWTRRVLNGWVYQDPTNPVLAVLAFKVGAHYRDAASTDSSYFYVAGSLKTAYFSGNYGKSKTFGAEAPVIE